MAKIQFNIPQILSRVGIRGYSPALGEAVNTLLNTQDKIEYEVALEKATTELSDYSGYSKESHFSGLPIYMPLVLQSVKPGGEDMVLDSALIALSQSKVIVKTPLEGRDGTVKEYINNGDHDINVTGLLCNKGPGYPKELVAELKTFLDAKKPIKVIHTVLNMMGINEVVIESWSLPHTPFTNGQTYKFKAVSEKAVELTIDE